MFDPRPSATRSADLSTAYLLAAPDAIVIVDGDGIIQLANAKAEELFGYPPDWLVGQPVETLVPEGDRTTHRAHRASYARNARVRPMGGPDSEFHGRRGDGSQFPVDISLSPVATDDGPRVVAVVRDLTPRLELEELRQRLNVTSERERIARDLHDLVIQRLFAAGMQLQAALGTPENLQKRAVETIDELDATITVIRESIFRLMSNHRTLADEIDLIVDRYHARIDGEITVRACDGLDELDESVRDHLLATLTEALSNVARHASASSVVVVLSLNDHLCLEVHDDGVGLADNLPTGFGVANMIERATALGGSVVLKARPGGGTALRWTVPHSGEAR